MNNTVIPPEEMAEQLVDKFYTLFDDSARLFRAKQCALISIEEIIKFGNQMGIREPMMYWGMVMSEVKKIENE